MVRIALMPDIGHGLLTLENAYNAKRAMRTAPRAIAAFKGGRLHQTGYDKYTAFLCEGAVYLRLLGSNTTISEPEVSISIIASYTVTRHPSLLREVADDPLSLFYCSISIAHFIDLELYIRHVRASLAP
ncbi:hypothetical protein D3C74_227620 [compost metagenome]